MSEDEDALIVRTREAHAALKDLKQVLKETKETITLAQRTQAELTAALVQAINDNIDEAINASIEVGLNNYATAIETAVDQATDAVYDRFDVIASILLGIDDDTTKIEADARLARKYMDRKEALTALERRRIGTLQDRVHRTLGTRPEGREP